MFVSNLLNGALAGLVATAPMTAAMEVMHRLLPRDDQYPLPPSEITAKVTEEAGVREKLDEQEHVALTLVNHFAYGTGAGGVYGLLARSLPLPPWLKGIVFGLIVWSVSYLGLLPALGILRPATQHPAPRNALMIAAHVVWGSFLGVLTDGLQRRERA